MNVNIKKSWLVKRTHFEYKQLILILILLSTFLPLMMLLPGRLIFGSQYISILPLSFLIILSDNHTWLSFTFYFNSKWRKLFNNQPLKFYVMPLLILVFSIFYMIHISSDLAFILIYFVALFNLFHHANQNWGILKLVGSFSGFSYKNYNFIVKNAWIFFLLSVSYWNHEKIFFIRNIPKEIILFLVIISSVLYFSKFTFLIYKNFNILKKNILQFTFLLGTLFYFIPLALWPNISNVFALVAGHALQYLLLIELSLTCNDRLTSPKKNIYIKILSYLMVMLFLLTLAYFVSSNFGNLSLSNNFQKGLIGIVQGVSLCHFWLDSFIWQFSRKEISNLHRHAFRSDFY